MKANQKGFSVVEILIVIVVVGLLGTVGWLVYDRQKNKTDSSTNQTTQQNSVAKEPETQKEVDPYEGWETYKSTSEGFTIKYPKDWKLTPVNISGSSSYISEQIVLNSTNDFHFDLDVIKLTSSGSGATSCSAASSIATVNGPNGSKLHVNIYTEIGTPSNDKKPYYRIGLSKWTNCQEEHNFGPYFPATKVDSAVVRMSGEFSKTNCGPVGCDPTEMSLDEFKAKDEVKTAKLILESLHY
jgi:prepilin-type N-terminal cleavage/methylation domain-containing protein